MAPGFETASASGVLTHYEADGERNFFWRTSGAAGPSPCGIASIDFNYDGVGDAVVANGSSGADPGRVTLLTAEYEYYERYYYYLADSLAAEAVPKAMAIAEITANGRYDLDIVTAGPTGMIALRMNDAGNLILDSVISVGEPVASVAPSAGLTLHAPAPRGRLSLCGDRVSATVVVLRRPAAARPTQDCVRARVVVVSRSCPCQPEPG